MLLRDTKRPGDHPASKLTGDMVSKAKDNVARLTKALEQGGPNVEFAGVGVGTDARYDKKTDTIFIAKDYRSVMEQEPKLLEPLLAHERVHAMYKSDSPADEASLQAYVNEELAAYQAEYAVWSDIKGEYTDPQKRAQLSPVCKELIHLYEHKFDRVEQQGWEGWRVQMEQEYRGRLDRTPK